MRRCRPFGVRSSRRCQGPSASVALQRRSSHWAFLLRIGCGVVAWFDKTGLTKLFPKCICMCFSLRPKEVFFVDLWKGFAWAGSSLATHPGHATEAQCRAVVEAPRDTWTTMVRQLRSAKRIFFF